VPEWLLRLSCCRACRMATAATAPSLPACAPLPCRSPCSLNQYLDPVPAGCRPCVQAVDCWAAGCIMGELLRHEPLFPAENEADCCGRIARLLGTPSPKIWPVSGRRLLPGAPPAPVVVFWGGGWRTPAAHALAQDLAGQPGHLATGAPPPPPSFTPPPHTALPLLPFQLSQGMSSLPNTHNIRWPDQPYNYLRRSFPTLSDAGGGGCCIASPCPAPLHSMCLPAPPPPKTPH
jgi:hypothetical protein